MQRNSLHQFLLQKHLLKTMKSSHRYLIVLLRANSTTVLAPTLGPVETNTSVNGAMITNMDREPSLGRMATNTPVRSRMVQQTDMVLTLIQMAQNTSARTRIG